jgi:hypothetical protein
VKSCLAVHVPWAFSGIFDRFNRYPAIQLAKHSATVAEIAGRKRGRGRKSGFVHFKNRGGISKRSSSSFSFSKSSRQDENEDEDDENEKSRALEQPNPGKHRQDRSPDRRNIGRECPPHDHRRAE